MKPIVHALALVLALTCTVSVTPASGQAAYPTRPIKIIVPYTPGTGIDILARLIGQKLGERLNVAVLKSVPYDPVKGFTPIAPTAIGNLALVVNPAVPARSVSELVTLAKAKPGTLNYASPGSGTPHHLAAELFKLHFGVDLTHVPYKGSAGAVTDLLGGQVQVMFLPVHVALPYVQGGKLRMLASGGSHRSPVTPDVPSLADEGITDIDVDIWYAFLGPPALAREQVALLDKEIIAILRDPEVRDTLQKQGLTPLPGTPEDLTRMITRDLERWTAVVRAAKIEAD